MIQIFAPKELATITTLGVECFILVLFVFMSGFVLRLFSRNDGADVDIPEGHDEHEEHEENIPLPTGLQHDVELGSAKCWTFHGR